MSKIYISGPITGIPNQNRKAFEEASVRLTCTGWDAVIPHDVSSETEWLLAMKADIKALMDCDAIFMLSEWQKSIGAVIEHDLAVKLGYLVFYSYMDFFNHIEDGNG